MNEPKIRYDIIVVGAGIAGLACAELLQRSGKSVMLVEKSSQICGGSSSDMAGWFHTGALYAPIPNPAFYKIMAGNVDDLLTYYCDFQRMNLGRSGSGLVSAFHDGWFTNALNQYVYTKWTSSEVPLWMKAPWSMAVKLAKARIEGFEHAHQTETLSSQVSWLFRTSKCSEGRPLGLNLGEVSNPVVTKDRTMRPMQIIPDLLMSFISAGGKLLTGADWDVIKTDYVADTYIMTKGRDNSLAEAKFISPLMVVYPPLCKTNFIKMTPKIQDTVNHLYHNNDGVEYSLVGSGDYLPKGATEGDRAKVEASLRRRVAEIFNDPEGGQVSHVYWGHKTEMCKTGQLRNYQYHIMETENSKVIEVLPGKFTLAFSLAVNVCKALGIAPTRILWDWNDKDLENHAHKIAKPRHWSAAETLAQPFQPL